MGPFSGNEFTMNTYKYANKPLFAHSNFHSSLFTRGSRTKILTDVRKSFLWFGSDGFIHKGLDLVLEAFAQMPDYNLTVCGPIQYGKGFSERLSQGAIQHFEYPYGWVGGYHQPGTLPEITNRCIGLFFRPAQSRVVEALLTCMHAGLIPIVSYECERGRE